MTRRGPYYPGAEVWQHPDAEQALASLNRNRAMYKAPPLVREKPATEDVIRERLQELDKERRQLARWCAKREGTT